MARGRQVSNFVVLNPPSSPDSSEVTPISAHIRVVSRCSPRPHRRQVRLKLWNQLTFSSPSMDPSEYSSWDGPLKDLHLAGRWWGMNWSYPLIPICRDKIWREKYRKRRSKSKIPAPKGGLTPPKKKQTSSVIRPLLSLRQDGCEDLSHLLTVSSLTWKENPLGKSTCSSIWVQRPGHVSYMWFTLKLTWPQKSGHVQPSIIWDRQVGSLSYGLAFGPSCKRSNPITMILEQVLSPPYITVYTFYWLIDSLIAGFVRSLIRSFICSFVHSFNHWLVDCLLDWLPDWLISCIHSCTW